MRTHWGQGGCRRAKGWHGHLLPRETRCNRVGDNRRCKAKALRSAAGSEAKRSKRVLELPAGTAHHEIKALGKQPAAARGRTGSGSGRLVGTGDELRLGDFDDRLRSRETSWAPSPCRVASAAWCLLCSSASLPPPPSGEREDSCSVIPGIRRGFSARADPPEWRETDNG